MKRGRTIAAEREYAESDSERMQVRKQVRRKHRISLLLVLAMLAMLVGLGYRTIGQIVQERKEQETADNDLQFVPTVPIVDETGSKQVSTRVKEYVGKMERDFHDLGYKVRQVTLPAGMTRTLYVDIEGLEGYFKVSLDRGTAVTAEDAVRMMKYLEEKGSKAEYVDVRVEGKAYYKEATALE